MPVIDYPDEYDCLPEDAQNIIGKYNEEQVEACCEELRAAGYIVDDQFGEIVSISKDVDEAELLRLSEIVDEDYVLQYLLAIVNEAGYQKLVQRYLDLI